MLKLRGGVIILQVVVCPIDKKESNRNKNIVFAGSTQVVIFQV